MNDAAMNVITADALPRFMQCNGSRVMAASFPASEIDETARDEGNAAHWLAQQVFAGADLASLIDKPAHNGFRITAEMADHVGEYLSALDCGEMEVDTSFAGPGWRVAARCDHRKYVVPSNTLIIDDLKYGWRLIDPFENWTLIAHAIGTCASLGITPATIILRIHQPRPWHPDGKMREWRLTYEELQGYYARIAFAMSAPRDELQTGPQCAKCHALATCPAARSARVNAIDATSVVFNDAMGNDALSYELDLFRSVQAMIDQQVDALEELAKHRLKSGAVITNYHMESQYGNTIWKPHITPEFLALTTKVDCTKTAIISPNEAKKRGIPEHVVKSLTDRPLKGKKLVRAETDKVAARLLGKR